MDPILTTILTTRHWALKKQTFSAHRDGLRNKIIII